MQGFAGTLAASEPNAALIGRDVLAGNGNAVDAAVAMGFAMTVTQPSRAGLGGGGACLVRQREGEGATAVVFPPVAEAEGGVVPLMARGLAALHGRFGSQRWALLVAPAEDLARAGFTMTRAFRQDVIAARTTVAADPGLAAAFLTEAGEPKAIGDPVLQPALASILAGIGQRGITYLTTPPFSRRLVDATAAGPLRLTVEALRNRVPTLSEAIALPAGDDTLYLPGGADPAGPMTAELWRQSAAGGEQALPLSGVGLAEGGAGFVVADSRGTTVACSFSMNGLFGTGRTIAGTGLIMARPPQEAVPLAVGIIAATKATRVAVSAGAGYAAPALLARTLAAGQATLGDPAAALARVTAAPGDIPLQALSCAGGQESCTAATDQRAAGLAVSLR